MQALHSYFIHYKKATQALHSHFTHDKKATQALHSHFTHCEKAPASIPKNVLALAALLQNTFLRRKANLILTSNSRYIYIGE